MKTVVERCTFGFTRSSCVIWLDNSYLFYLGPKIRPRFYITRIVVEVCASDERKRPDFFQIHLGVFCSFSSVKFSSVDVAELTVNFWEHVLNVAYVLLQCEISKTPIFNITFVRRRRQCCVLFAKRTSFGCRRDSYKQLRSLWRSQ